MRKKRRSDSEGSFDRVGFWLPVIHQHLYDDFAQTDTPIVQNERLAAGRTPTQTTQRNFLNPFNALSEKAPLHYNILPILPPISRGPYSLPFPPQWREALSPHGLL